MKALLILVLYNVLYPLFLFLSLPGYLIKMYKRGGFGTGLMERFGYYKVKKEKEPQGVIYVHAVSVGEVLIALKWIREWLVREKTPVVLATSTSTGHEVARKQAPEGVRILYSPLDLPGLPGCCLERFSPVALVLIEAELWPNMGMAARKRGIPLIMLNARLSARSERRYRKVLPLANIFFSFLDKVCVQDAVDASRFEGIGIPSDKIVVTGSIKFDQKGVSAPGKRAEFSTILEQLAQGKPIVLAASTHAGEEVLIASAARECGYFPLIVPRHAERRMEIARELKKKGWEPVLRSDGILPAGDRSHVCYIADTTGELKDWTAHADMAVIGKSFLAEGGQNPAEAVAAGVPVITGPHMENFQALVDLLEEAKGIARCDAADLAATLRGLCENPQEARRQAENARQALESHYGATQKSVELVASLRKKDMDI